MPDTSSQNALSSDEMFDFDNPLRGEPATPADEAAGVPGRIASVLKEAGVDAPADLYNEAVLLAREGHLGQAQNRLQMLLCLDPEDAEALLLLAKIHNAQGRYQDALARLDAAAAVGSLPPAGMREQLEAALRQERAREEEHRTRSTSREHGEIRALRNEARQLRSDNIRLEAEVTEGLRRERLWKTITAGTALFGTVVVVLLWAFSGAPATEAVVAAPAASVAEAAAPAVAEVAAPVAPVDAAPASGPKPPKPTAAGDKVMAGNKIHVVGSGDTLSVISKKYYGTTTRYKEIAAANQDVLKGKEALSLGMKLRVP